MFWIAFCTWSGVGVGVGVGVGLGLGVGVGLGLGVGARLGPGPYLGIPLVLLERGVHSPLRHVEGAADGADELVERVLKVRLEELVRARARGG